MQIKKGDIVNRAYSRLRISGLTVNPSPEDVSLAMTTLESMMAELESITICTGYNVEPFAESDPDTESGIGQEYFNAISLLLSGELCPDFGKEPSPKHQALIDGAYATLSNASFKAREVPYPNRMPRGSGNRIYRFNRYFPQDETPQRDCDRINVPITLLYGVTLNWDEQLDDGETIVSSSYKKEGNFTVSDYSFTDTTVSFNVQNETLGYTDLIVTITTSIGRTTKRKVQFQFVGIEEA